MKKMAGAAGDAAIFSEARNFNDFDDIVGRLCDLLCDHVVFPKPSGYLVAGRWTSDWRWHLRTAMA